MTQQTSMLFSQTSNQGSYNWTIPQSLYFQYPHGFSTSLAGLAISGNVNLEGGLKGGVSATAGSYSISYPLNINAVYAANIVDGAAFTIDTSNYSIPSALININGPGIGFYCTLSLTEAASLNIYGQSIINQKYEYSAELKSGAKFDVGNYGSVSLTAPVSFNASSNTVSTSSLTCSSLPSLYVEGHGDNFLQCDINLTNILLSAQGLPALASNDINIFGKILEGIQLLK